MQMPEVSLPANQARTDIRPPLPKQRICHRSRSDPCVCTRWAHAERQIPMLSVISTRVNLWRFADDGLQEAPPIENKDIETLACVGPCALPQLRLPEGAIAQGRDLMKAETEETEETLGV